MQLNVAVDTAVRQVAGHLAAFIHQREGTDLARRPPFNRKLGDQRKGPVCGNQSCRLRDDFRGVFGVVQTARLQRLHSGHPRMI